MGYEVSYDGHLTVAADQRDAALQAVNEAVIAEYPREVGYDDWDELLDNGLRVEHLFDDSLTNDGDTIYFSGRTKWATQEIVLRALGPYATGEYRGEGEEPGDFFIFVLAKGVCTGCRGWITYDTSELPEGVMINEW